MQINYVFKKKDSHRSNGLVSIRKKPNISSYFYNVYMSVFLVYFLCFLSMTDWWLYLWKLWNHLELCMSPSIPFAYIFILTTQFIPSKADVVHNSAYSNCCCWQLRLFHQLLLTVYLIYLLLLLRVLPSTSAITGMMLTALPSPPPVCSVLSFNPPYLLYLWATTLVFGLSSM